MIFLKVKLFSMQIRRLVLIGIFVVTLNLFVSLYIYSILASTHNLNDTTRYSLNYSESTDRVTLNSELNNDQLTKQPVSIDCYEEGVVPHPSDMSKFFRCTRIKSSWRQEVFQCQPQTHFQQGLKRCASISKGTKARYIVPRFVGDSETEVRRNFVKKMAKDAWDDYVQYAWGSNELMPINKSGHEGDIFGSAKLGATIVDSLDTLYIMGLDEEFKAARNFVAHDLQFKTDMIVSVFETNIRFVGGLLSAYALTQDEIFLTKAYEVATLLLPAFNTSTGIPHSYIKINSSAVEATHQGVLADFGSLHLEFLYLSQITSDQIFKDKAVAIRKFIREMRRGNGLYCNYMDITSGECMKDQVAIGPGGDSFYEYLLKSAIQFNDLEAREMYDDAISAFVNNGLVKVSPQSNLLYIAEFRDGQVVDIVYSLTCFAGGLLALGSFVSPNNTNTARDFELGLNFTNTCHESYIRTKTQLGPDVFRFGSTVEATSVYTDDKVYKLRPETVESYFVLYRITGDQKYRDWGWEVVQAIQKHCKIGDRGGYSGLLDVYLDDPSKDDIQQTFLLAETLKYLYLLFSDKDLLPLGKWVFNTEGHPLPIALTNPLY